ncbi:unnamed protein product [Acanthoscelides obtectus]|uniref:Tryptophan-rich sensory protein n=1 Tax=Acanthoscelides obtectus TaxID=200917 RepID=A0A9P0KCK4_ACAOB|nr:unnamed protein product [Acanthoscelides obtectus]CAK1622833.1 Translocator protein [Acanthoscelides obtectus]
MMDPVTKINIVQAISAILIPNFGEVLILLGYKQYYNDKDVIVLPKWTMSNAAFTMAWISLYSLIGYSSFLIIKYGNTEHKLHKITKISLVLFGMTVALSWSWRFVLFISKNIIMAWVLAIILDLVAILTVIVFFLIKPTVSSLLLPYIIWLMFNTLFNFALISLNK